MAVVTGYRFRCTTEGVDKEVWRTEEQGTPTKCPDDTSHTIDLNSLTQIGQEGGDVAPVRQAYWDTVDPNHIDTLTQGCSLDISQDDLISTGYEGYNITVDMVCAYFYYEDAVIGDYVILDGHPEGDPAIGAVTEAAAQGATKVKVNDSILPYFYPGYYFHAAHSGGLERYILWCTTEGCVKEVWATSAPTECPTDSGHTIKSVVKDDKEYEIKSVDIANKELTLVDGLAQAISASADARFRRRTGHRFWIVPKMRLPIGKEIPEVYGLPDTMTFRARYYHKSPAAQDGLFLGWSVARY